MANEILVIPLGSVGSSRAAYISKAKLGENEGPERALFTDDQEISISSANDLTAAGRFEIVVSLRRATYEKLGHTEAERERRFVAGIRSGVSYLLDDLGIVHGDWYAGVHRNTENPHAHIVFGKTFLAKNGIEIRRDGLPPGWAYASRSRLSRAAEHFAAALDISVSAGLVPQSGRFVFIDLEGVVADARRRFEAAGRNFEKGSPEYLTALLHPEAVAGDAPIPGASGKIQDFQNAGWTPIYLSARPESLRQTTHAWLQRHGFPDSHVILRRDDPDDESSVAEWKTLAAARFLSDLDADPEKVLLVDDAAETRGRFRRAGDGWRAVGDLGTNYESLTSALEEIPKALKALPNWTLWAALKSSNPDTKPRKVPIQPSGKLAKSTDPKTWRTFRTVEAALKRNSLLEIYDPVVREMVRVKPAGAFLALTPEDGLAGVDLDKCRNPETGELTAEAQEIVRRFAGAYIEASPSGAGIRIFCLGTVARSGKAERIEERWVEAYDGRSPRFLSVTGHVLPESAQELVPMQSALDWLHTRYFSKPEKLRPPQSRRVPSPDDDLEYAKKCLDLVDSRHADDYQDWIVAGAVLKNNFGQAGFEIWDAWSRQSPKYDAKTIQSTWKALKPKSGQRGFGIFKTWVRQSGQILPARADSRRSSPVLKPDSNLHALDSSNLKGPAMSSFAKHAELANEVFRLLQTGGSFANNRDFFTLAERVFAGSEANGDFTAKDAYDALETGVNLHLQREAGRLLSLPPTQALQELIALTKALPVQATRTEKQMLLQQFSTPPGFAFAAYLAGGVRPEDVVLEPSAGTASLAIWAAAKTAVTHVNEIDDRRKYLLGRLGFSPERITAKNAEFLNDVLPADIRPTVVLMNPPFSATGGRTKNSSKYGAEHVSQALKRLQDGGRLVAIVGEGMALDKLSFLEWWRKISNQYTVRANIAVPGNVYYKYGTNFGTQLIVIDKTGPTPGGDFTERTKNVIQAKVETLEELVVLAERIGHERANRLEPIVEELPGNDGRILPKRLVRRGDEKAATLQAPAVSFLRADPRSGSTQTHANHGEGDSRNSESLSRSVGTASGQDRLRGAEGLRPSDSRHPGESRRLSGTDGITDSKISTSTQNLNPVEGSSREAQYKPAKVHVGSPHPAKILETPIMSGVIPPDISYVSKLPSEIIREGKISNAQLEAVLYAGQSHEQFLPNGERRGFLIGDGTGVGKGREIAAIALDNWHQGRKKFVWFSKNFDLFGAAQRDFADLGSPIPLGRIDTWKGDKKLNEFFPEGMLFVPYSTLTAQTKGGQTRFDQVREWLGNDAILFFDEAHLAKNAQGKAEDKKQASQRGEKVVQLQTGETSNPNWRIVYVSATAASDVKHFYAYTRLGLWGIGTGFPGGFSEFENTIEAAGVNAMELIPPHLKAEGAMLARSISFDGTSFKNVFHNLSAEQVRIYEGACEAWQLVMQNFQEALDITGSNVRARNSALSQFWGGQQRFFNGLITAFKIPTLIDEVESYLKDGVTYVSPVTGESERKEASVVITLISTGEAATKREVVSATQAGRDFESLDFSGRSVLKGLVDKCFPTQRYVEKQTEGGGTQIVPLIDDNGLPVHSQEALEMKERLLNRLDELILPENPLDQIVNHFGPNNVAEITGRTKRLERDQATGAVRYVKRAREGVSIEKASEDEMRLFQEGRKRIAILSEAGSTGISLHDDSRNPVSRRRVQILLQPSWAADNAIQTFGRTHRSGQTTAPEYVLLASDLGGERRFLSTIARRLEQLGALTKGDRTETGGASLAQFNFETSYGFAACQTLFRRLAENSPGVMEGIQSFADKKVTGPEILYKMGVAKKEEHGRVIVSEGKLEKIPVKQFLNRLLILEPTLQNRVFEAFTGTLDEIIEWERHAGKYDDGIKEIHGGNLRLAADPQVVWVNENSGASTTYYKLLQDTPTNPVSFDEVVSELANVKKSQYAGFWQNKTSQNIIFVSPAGFRTDPTTSRSFPVFKFARPGGWQTNRIGIDELFSKYKQVRQNDRIVYKKESVVVSEWWKGQYRDTPQVKTDEIHIVGGNILNVWNRLAAGQSLVKAVRARLETGQPIVGVGISSQAIGRVLRELGGSKSLVSAQDVFTAIENDENVQLVGGLVLRRGHVRGNPVISVENVASSHKDQMTVLGIQSDIFNYRLRFWIPANPETAQQILTQLLNQYPVLTPEPVNQVQPLSSLKPVEPAPVTPATASQADTPVVASEPVEAELVTPTPYQAETPVIASETVEAAPVAPVVASTLVEAAPVTPVTVSESPAVASEPVEPAPAAPITGSQADTPGIASAPLEAAPVAAMTVLDESPVAVIPPALVEAQPVAAIPREVILRNYTEGHKQDIFLGFFSDSDQVRDAMVAKQAQLRELVKNSIAFPMRNGSGKWQIGRSENCWHAVFTDRSPADLEAHPLPTLEQFLRGEIPQGSSRVETSRAEPFPEIITPEIEVQIKAIALLMAAECFHKKVSLEEKGIAARALDEKSFGSLAESFGVWKKFQGEQTEVGFNNLVRASVSPQLAERLAKYGNDVAARVVSHAFFNEDGSPRSALMAATRIERTLQTLKTDPSARKLIEASRRSPQGPHASQEWINFAAESLKRFREGKGPSWQIFSRFFEAVQVQPPNPVSQMMTLLQARFPESDRPCLEKILDAQNQEPPTSQQIKFLANFKDSSIPESRLQASLQSLNRFEGESRERAIQRYVESVRGAVAAQSQGVVWAAEMRRPVGVAEMRQYQPILDRIDQAARAQGLRLTDDDRRFLGLIVSDHDRFGLYNREYADPLRDFLAREDIAEKIKAASIEISPDDSRLGIRLKLVAGQVVSDEQAFKPYLNALRAATLRPDALIEGENMLSPPKSAPAGRVMTPDIGRIAPLSEDSTFRLWAVPKERIFDRTGSMCPPPPVETVAEYLNLVERSPERVRDFLVEKGYDAAFADDRLIVLDDARAILWSESHNFDEIKKVLAEPLENRQERLARSLAGIALLLEEKAGLAQHGRAAGPLLVDREGARLSPEEFLKLLRIQTQTETLTELRNDRIAPEKAAETAARRYAELETAFSKSLGDAEALVHGAQEERAQIARRLEERASQLKETSKEVEPIFAKPVFESALRDAAQFGDSATLLRFAERLQSARREDQGIGGPLGSETQRVVAVSALLSLAEMRVAKVQLDQHRVTYSARPYSLPETVCLECAEANGRAVQRHWTLEEISAIWLAARESHGKDSAAVKAAESLHGAWMSENERFRLGLESNFQEAKSRSAALSRIADHEGVVLHSPSVFFNAEEMHRLSDLVQASGYDEKMLLLWEGQIEKSLDLWRVASVTVLGRHGADAKKAGIDLAQEPGLIWRAYQEIQQPAHKEQEQELKSRGFSVPGNRLEARLAIDRANGNPWASLKQGVSSLNDSPLIALSEARNLTVTAYVGRQAVRAAVDISQSPCVKVNESLIGQKILERIIHETSAKSQFDGSRVAVLAKAGLENCIFTTEGRRKQSPFEFGLRRIVSELEKGVPATEIQKIARMTLSEGKGRMVRGSEVTPGIVRYQGKEWALSPLAAKNLGISVQARASVGEREGRVRETMTRLDAVERRTSALMRRIEIETPSLAAIGRVAPLQAAAIREGVMHVSNPKTFEWALNRLETAATSGRQAEVSVDWSLRGVLEGRRAEIAMSANASQNRERFIASLPTSPRSPEAVRIPENTQKYPGNQGVSLAR